MCLIVLTSINRLFHPVNDNISAWKVFFGQMHARFKVLLKLLGGPKLWNRQELLKKRQEFSEISTERRLRDSGKKSSNSTLGYIEAKKHENSKKTQREWDF